MKKTVILAALMLASTVSQAKTYCSVNLENPAQKSVYDQTVFQGELTEPKILAIKKGATKAEEVKITETTDFRKWSDLNGATLISVSLHEGVYALSIGRIDVSKSENIFPMESYAMGTIAPGKFLSLISERRKISVNCANLAQ